MRGARWVGILITTAVVVGMVIYGFLPKPVLVDSARAEIGPLTVAVTEEGKTRVVDRFLISAPVTGFARRIDLDVGAEVKAGDVVATLESQRSQVPDTRSRAQAENEIASAEARLEAAKEQVRAATASADLARLEHERRRKLRETDDASQQEVELAEADERRTRAQLRSAEFEVDVARFQLESARTRLRFSAAEEEVPYPETVPIRSPVAGRVLAVHHESEGIVLAGAQLLEVGDARTLEVEVDVLSEDAVRIEPGMRVLFERWGGPKPLEGRVRTVEPTGFTKISALGVEEQRVLIISDIVSPPAEWSRLGDGYRVEASFLIHDLPEVLRIPTSSLFRQADGWAVFRVEGDVATATAVQVGPRNGLEASITGGLSAGDEVIVHPGDNVASGVRVARRDAAE